jgi:hypothetical protein
MNELLIYHHHLTYNHNNHHYQHINADNFPSVKQTYDLNEFLVARCKKLSVFYLPPDVANQLNASLDYANHSEKYVNSILQIIDASDHGIIEIPEIHEVSVDILKILDRLVGNKITAFTPCIYNQDFDRINVVNNFAWENVTKRSSIFIPEVKNLLAQLNSNSYHTKHKLFDILLGTGGNGKPHRHFLYDMINNTTLKDKVIMNFRGTLEHPIDNAFLIDEDGYEEMPLREEIHNIHSCKPIKLFGEHMNLAYMIPINIYKQTAYSVVAETGCSNDFSLITEKTFKPILCKRLFIMFAGQHYLRHLRSIGYQTFEGIIDETYDTIADPYVRWSLAFNQMMWLSTQYQQVILERAKPILEHNHAHMISRNDTDEIVINHTMENVIKRMIAP